MKQFSYEPCDGNNFGKYRIIRWNALSEQWKPMINEIYLTEEAKQRVDELNNECND